MNSIRDFIRRGAAVGALRIVAWTMYAVAVCVALRWAMHEPTIWDMRRDAIVLVIQESAIAACLLWMLLVKPSRFEVRP